MDIKGMTYGYMAARGDYRSPIGKKSQEKLYDLGVNWICIPVVNNQKDINSTDIYRKYSDPSDRDLISVIEDSHSRGVKVCLKPIVNSDDYLWRAHIGLNWVKNDDSNPIWEKWFKSYTAYILYYAELAEETGCEMLCIGCEMLGTEHRETDWTTLIRRVRCTYHGKLVYNTNHHAEEGAMWFDELDYIGTSAYYCVGVNGTDKASMVLEWEKTRERLNELSERKGKQYIFMEVGCRSASGCSLMPWDFEQSLPANEQEQADFYESCLEVFANDKHFGGVFWWDWSTKLPYSTKEEAKLDIGYDIHLKKTEDVLKKAYSPKTATWNHMDEGVMLLSNPPRYPYKCSHCGYRIYVFYGRGQQDFPICPGCKSVMEESVLVPQESTYHPCTIIDEFLK